MALPTPYYSENNARIYNGDCLDIMRGLPTGSISLVVTDPPYMIGPISTHNQAFWGDMMNSALWYGTWYQEVKRLLAYDGAMWSFLNWKTVPTLIRAATIAELPILSLMVWDKQNLGGGHPAGLRGSYELVALMARPGFRMATADLPDVWRHQWSPRRGKFHPAQKPTELLKRLISESGTAGIVLDPFMGSGSTLVAARELGRPVVGIEQEPKYCQLATERLTGAPYQPHLIEPSGRLPIPPILMEVAMQALEAPSIPLPTAPRIHQAPALSGTIDLHSLRTQEDLI